MGVCTEVKKHELIEYDIADGRHVRVNRVNFEQLPEGVKITTTFEPYPGNPEEMERGGWQAISNNFKKYAESHK